MTAEEVEQMDTGSHAIARPREKSRLFEIGQFLFVIGLAVAVYFLGQSMIHHRFFRGGHINQRSILQP